MHHDLFSFLISSSIRSFAESKSVAKLVEAIDSYDPASVVAKPKHQNMRKTRQM
jgi:hypothetical protein